MENGGPSSNSIQKKGLQEIACALPSCTDDSPSPGTSRFKGFFEASSGSISFAYKELQQIHQNPSMKEPSFHIILQQIAGDEGKDNLPPGVSATNLKLPRLRPSFQNLNLLTNKEDFLTTPVKSSTRISTNFSKALKHGSTDDKKNLSSASIINRKRRTSEYTDCNSDSLLLGYHLNPITPGTHKKNFSLHDENVQMFDFEPDDQDSRLGKSVKKNFTSAIVQCGPGHFKIITADNSNRQSHEISEHLPTNLNNKQAHRHIKASLKASVVDHTPNSSVRLLNYMLVRKILSDTFKDWNEKNTPRLKKRQKFFLAFMCHKPKEKSRKEESYVSFLKNSLMNPSLSKDPSIAKASSDLLMIFEELLRQAFFIKGASKQVQDSYRRYFDLSSNIVKDAINHTKDSERTTQEILLLKQSTLLNSCGVLGLICLVEFVAKNFGLYGQLSDLFERKGLSASVTLLELTQAFAEVDRQLPRGFSKEEALEDFVISVRAITWIFTALTERGDFSFQSCDIWKQTALRVFLADQTGYKKLFTQISQTSVKEVLTTLLKL